MDSHAIPTHPSNVVSKNVLYPAHPSPRAEARLTQAVPGAWRRLALSGACLLAMTLPGWSQYFLTAGDAFGTSSFNTAGHWDNGLAPSSGNTYSTNGFLLRTPTGAGDHTFAGDSLTIDTNGQLSYKGSDGYTITANLIMDGGLFTNGGTTTLTLAGSVSLASASRFECYGEFATLSSLVSGSSLLRLITNSGNTNGGLILTNSGNSYSGGTLIDNFASLFAQADGALGTGDVTLLNSSSLTLSGGTTNNYIGNSASLIVGSSSMKVDLAFSGVDTIGALSLDGGSTFLANGTYGAVGSGADHTFSVFSGTGILSVVPEPTSTSLALVSLGALCLRRRTRRA